MKSFFKNIYWLYKNCKNSLLFIIALIVLGIFSSIVAVSKALASKSLIDSITNNNDSIFKCLLFLAGLMLLGIIISAVTNIISTYASQKLKNKIQIDLYKTIIKSHWQYISNYHSVDLLTRINNDVSTITNLVISIVPDIISLFVMLVLSFITLLKLSKFMSIFAISLFPILLLISKFYGHKLKQFYIELQKKESVFNSFVQESFNNIMIVKTFTLENSKINTLNLIQTQKLSLTMKKSIFSSISNSILMLGSTIGYFSVYVWGAYSINTGNFSFGNLTAMLQLFGTIQSPILGLTSSFPQLINAIAAIDRLTEIENLTSEIYVEDNIENKLTYPISLNNVSYGYKKDTLILKNISLHIVPGERIALIGPSGSGKTTIIRLLLYLIEPTNGTIKINNEELSTKHRNLISYVPQGNTLFSGTIRENLCISNSEINNNDIYKALKAACAYDFVNNLTNKLDTVIGERGIGLSEGQAQRLCIARALLKNAPILILDESTSALDADSEIMVLDSIKELTDKTIILITHRPSALSICDNIYKIVNGRLELCKKKQTSS